VRFAQCAVDRGGLVGDLLRFRIDECDAHQCDTIDLQAPDQGHPKHDPKWVLSEIVLAGWWSPESVSTIHPFERVKARLIKGGSGDFLTPSPPAEHATARQD
jgi:hypothetical protein